MSNSPFLNAIDKLKQRRMDIEAQAQYMSDMKHYLMVHATKYFPLTRGSDEKYIPSTAMATNYKHPRSTIHMALNHVVNSHGYGSWDEMQYIIMAPLTDVIALNGNPADMSVPDTYFSVHPDTGLRLPANTHIVMPAMDIPDGQLFQIRGNTTVYKARDFTPEETENILSNMDDFDRAKYDKYKSANLSAREIDDEIYRIGDTGKKLYDAARDKMAFVRGLFADKCEAMLATHLRNVAAQETATHMGFQTIQCTSDGSEPLVAVARVADAHNIYATIANKGHSNSIYGVLDVTDASIRILQDRLNENSDNLELLATYLTTAEYIPYRRILLQALLPDKNLDVYDIFVSTFESEKNQWYNTRFHDCKTIADWDAKTDETIRRYCQVKNREFEPWLQKIKSMLGYTEFVNKIQLFNLIRTPNRYEH